MFNKKNIDENQENFEKKKKITIICLSVALVFITLIAGLFLVKKNRESRFENYYNIGEAVDENDSDNDEKDDVETINGSYFFESISGQITENIILFLGVGILLFIWENDKNNKNMQICSKSCNWFDNLTSADDNLKKIFCGNDDSHGAGLCEIQNWFSFATLVSFIVITFLVEFGLNHLLIGSLAHLFSKDKGKRYFHTLKMSLKKRKRLFSSSSKTKIFFIVLSYLLYAFAIVMIAKASPKLCYIIPNHHANYCCCFCGPQSEKNELIKEDTFNIIDIDNKKLNDSQIKSNENNKIDDLSGECNDKSNLNDNISVNKKPFDNNKKEEEEKKSEIINADDKNKEKNTISLILKEFNHDKNWDNNFTRRSSSKNLKISNDDFDENFNNGSKIIERKLSFNLSKSNSNFLNLNIEKNPLQDGNQSSNNSKNEENNEKINDNNPFSLNNSNNKENENSSQNSFDSSKEEEKKSESDNVGDKDVQNKQKDKSNEILSLSLDEFSCDKNTNSRTGSPIPKIRSHFKEKFGKIEDNEINNYSKKRKSSFNSLKNNEIFKTSQNSLQNNNNISVQNSNNNNNINNIKIENNEDNKDDKDNLSEEKNKDNLFNLNSNVKCHSNDSKEEKKIENDNKDKNDSFLEQNDSTDSTNNINNINIKRNLLFDLKSVRKIDEEDNFVEVSDPDTEENNEVTEYSSKKNTAAKNSHEKFKIRKPKTIKDSLKLQSKSIGDLRLFKYIENPSSKDIQQIFKAVKSNLNINKDFYDRNRELLKKYLDSSGKKNKNWNNYENSSNNNKECDSISKSSCSSNYLDENGYQKSSIFPGNSPSNVIKEYDSCSSTDYQGNIFLDNQIENDYQRNNIYPNDEDYDNRLSTNNQYYQNQGYSNNHRLKNNINSYPSLNNGYQTSIGYDYADSKKSFFSPLTAFFRGKRKGEYERVNASSRSNGKKFNNNFPNANNRINKDYSGTFYCRDRNGNIAEFAKKNVFANADKNIYYNNYNNYNSNFSYKYYRKKK